MLVTMKNNRSLTFYQAPLLQPKKRDGGIYSAGVIAPALSNATFTTQVYTNNVNAAYAQIKASVVDRGLQYANNTAASRGGYMAENWHAETYNLDATIKGSSTSAEVPSTTKLASADIVIDDKTNVSLKYYKDAKSSATAQTNPGYKDQVLLVPEDQLPDAKEALKAIADKNIKKGRNDAAELQKETINRLTDRLESPDGVSSTPLSKSEDIELANAIKADDGTIEIDEAKIDELLKKKGVLEKKETAVLKNELYGIGIAAAIGLGVGFTISAITTLAQSGITPDSLKIAAAEGVKGGIESGILSVVGYGIGRTIGQIATDAAAGILENIGVTITDNISKMLNMGVVGALTVAVFSVYQFAKLKQQGMATREALLQVGKQALFSLSILAVSIAAQGIWGGPAGIIVSTSIGIILIAYSVTDSVHQRHFAERVRVYTIEKCRPYFPI